MQNEFLNPLRTKLDGMIAAGVISAGAIEALRKEVDRVPEMQGSCGVCMREVDHLEPSGQYVGTDPIEVHRCSNGCRGCSECVHVCSNGACGLAICENCSEMCSGCADRFCSDHITADPDGSDMWCEECLPLNKRRKLALIKAGDSMRD